MSRTRLLPRGRVARRSRGLVLGGIWLRCSTRWRARELDRELAAGADPIDTDALSLRVGQLGSRATRVRLVSALRRAVELAHGHQAPLVTTRLRRAQIRENDELLLAVAERIHDGGPLGVRGVAMTSYLVNDRMSPLYSEDAQRPLSVTALEALVELDRGIRTAGVPEMATGSD